MPACWTNEPRNVHTPFQIDWIVPQTAAHPSQIACHAPSTASLKPSLVFQRTVSAVTKPMTAKAMMPKGLSAMTTLSAPNAAVIAPMMPEIAEPTAINAPIAATTPLNATTAAPMPATIGNKNSAIGSIKLMTPASAPVITLIKPASMDSPVLSAGSSIASIGSTAGNSADTMLIIPVIAATITCPAPLKMPPNESTIALLLVILSNVDAIELKALSSAPFSRSNCAISPEKSIGALLKPS